MRRWLTGTAEPIGWRDSPSSHRFAGSPADAVRSDHDAEKSEQTPGPLEVVSLSSSVRGASAGPINPETVQIPPALTNWIGAFRTLHGRPPRILHVGNIANNAYNNAKLLNSIGLDCDVICYDYYHVMGCPEWEDAYFLEAPQDQFYPDWTVVDLNGFARPEWFAQGPLELCCSYLIAKRSGTLRDRKRRWAALEVANRTRKGGNRTTRLQRLQETTLPALGRRLRALLYDATIVERLARKLGSWTPPNRALSGLLYLALVGTAVAGVLLLRAGHLPIRAMRRLMPTRRRRDGFDRRVAELVALFRHRFPGRADQLAAKDAEMYRGVVPVWRELFRQYDLVQAYATDPILPLLCETPVYVAFEHGTLRSHTLGDDSVCRLNSLAYNAASHTFITNGDCLDYAQRIGVTRYSPMLHPLDERKIIARRGEHRARMLREFDVDHLFLCTLRHDWSVKGTDKYIRALPGLVEAIGPRFKVIMTTWGAQLQQSRDLAGSLGVAGHIHWIDPLPKLRLIEFQKSVDALFDQIALPHFGATAPEAIAAGVPVLMSYDSANTTWIVPAPAPILSCWTVEDIVRNVQVALDPTWREKYQASARDWIDQYHSARHVLAGHLAVYGSLLGKTPQAQSSTSRPAHRMQHEI